MKKNILSSMLLPVASLAVFGCSGAPVDSPAGSPERTATAGEAIAGGPPSAGAASAALPPLTTLTERRPFVTFPAYTPDQRQLLANQAQILLRDLYVHRFEKIAYYGAEVDPVPRVEDLVNNARTMTDAELQLALQDIFSSTRDLHTNFYFPAPYGCNESFLPFDLTELRSNRETPRLVVADTWSAPKFTALDPALAQVHAGDLLVSYDGKDPEDALEELVVAGAGANFWGGRRRAMQAMTFRYHLMQALPASDVTHLEFRRVDGSTYAVEMPWLAYSWCPAPSSGTGASAGAPTPTSARGALAVNVFQREFQERAGLAARKADGLSLKPSADPILSYGTLTDGGNTYGYLSLSSFDPTITIDAMVDEVARILHGELANTSGLIFDVRDNGGGIIFLADKLLQLFSPHHVEPMQFRLKNSALNAFLWDTWAPYAPGNPFIALIDAARQTHAEYTKTAPLTDEPAVNRLSQAYFGPVAVLTNSACYSSCDMFVAGMQDNHLATVWGEDERTGAGGANVLNYSDFAGSLPLDNQGPFLPLPGGQDMRVAWRDAIRAGSHEGDILEDYGVSADRDAALTLDDVLHAGATQLARITKGLSAQAPSHPSRVLFSDGEVPLRVAAGSAISLPASVVATTSVEYLLDGARIGGQKIASDGSVTLSPAGYVVQGSGSHQLELRGRNGHRAAWRAFRTIVVAP